MHRLNNAGARACNRPGRRVRRLDLAVELDAPLVAASLIEGLGTLIVGGCAQHQGDDPGNVRRGGLEDLQGAFPAGSWLTQISWSVAKPSPRALAISASTLALGGWGERERIHR